MMTRTWLLFVFVVASSVTMLLLLAAVTLTSGKRGLTFIKSNRFQVETAREVLYEEAEDPNALNDDDTVARELYDKVRVLCWVMTTTSLIRIKYIVRTWGRRCNKLVIISSVANAQYGIVAINVSEGRDHLTEKTLGGFRYVYEHHFDDADWFLKTDDDTYVIMENLRYFLSAEDTNEPVYFGHHFKPIEKFDYSSGGSGFVVSKEALRRFGKAGSDSKVCRQTGTAGDAAFGECMGNLGVKLKNSTDKFGKSRFHSFPPYNHVAGALPHWLHKYDKNQLKSGVDGLSDYVISFHYVSKSKMETLEYLIYHARVFGIQHRMVDVNQH